MGNLSDEGTVAASETMEGPEGTGESPEKIVITDSDLVPLEELDTSVAVVGPVTAKVISLALTVFGGDDDDLCL